MFLICSIACIIRWITFLLSFLPHDLTQSPVPCQPFTSKLPKMGQPDLDFTAPEVQATSTCSPLSDMFSLGMLICAIFNDGRSLIDANHSATNYNKQLELVSIIHILVYFSCQYFIFIFFFKFVFSYAYLLEVHGDHDKFGNISRMIYVTLAVPR